jgi:NAD(P)H-hydrate repair Nnr-like enzyme with NAD(P)H-hydrate epimerase domain
VIARHLAAAGWDVRCLTDDWQDILGSRFRTGDAGAAARAWVAAGGTAGPITPEAVAEASRGAAVLVDALLGIGQNRPADALLAPVQAGLDRLGEQGEALPAVVAVDVPTGRDADTGAALAQDPLDPDLCITFHAAKPVHALLRAAGTAVVVVDIGLSATSI